jgi:biopolymer transport protein ExbB
MVGLFGTVLSMIGVFDSISHGGNKSIGPDQVKDIGLALFATALGLITAIPLVFSHVLFKAWVARFELRLKSAAQRLLLLLQNVKSDGKGGAAQAQALTAPIKPGADPSSIARR